MEKKNGYYDFDIDVEVWAHGACLSELMWLRDIQRRKFYLNDDVAQETVHEIARHILQINREDDDAGLDPADRQPILLYIVSNGGEVDSGFELIDVIEASTTPVWTVNLGYQYSMGFLIGLAGHRRYATKNAKFLMHDGSNFIWNSGSKAQDQMEFQKRVEGRVRDYVLSHSRVTPEEYDSKERVEWYLFADEAKEKGFTDYIVGADRPIEEIV